MIELITRDHCPLCEPVEGLLHTWCGRLGLRLRIVDVDQDPRLAEEFGERLPIVRDSRGEVLAEGQVKKRKLVRQLFRVRYSR